MYNKSNLNIVRFKNKLESLLLKLYNTNFNNKFPMSKEALVIAIQEAQVYNINLKQIYLLEKIPCHVKKNYDIYVKFKTQILR